MGFRLRKDNALHRALGRNRTNRKSQIQIYCWAQ